MHDITLTINTEQRFSPHFELSCSASSSRHWIEVTIYTAGMLTKLLEPCILTAVKCVSAITTPLEVYAESGNSLKSLWNKIVRKHFDKLPQSDNTATKSVPPLPTPRSSDTITNSDGGLATAVMKKIRDYISRFGSSPNPELASDIKIKNFVISVWGLPITNAKVMSELIKRYRKMDV